MYKSLFDSVGVYLPVNEATTSEVIDRAVQSNCQFYKLTAQCCDLPSGVHK